MDLGRFRKGVKQCLKLSRFLKNKIKYATFIYV